MRRALLATLVVLASCAPDDGARFTVRPACVRDAGTGDAPPPVWGIADLHTHPAAELAFGGGVIAGTRGDGWDHACDGEGHGRGDSNPARRIVRSIVLSYVRQNGSHPHGPAGHTGAPTDEDYAAWPHGRDILHRQMSTADMLRAYEGGLRLLVASVTDNQSLEALFRGYDHPTSVHHTLEREVARTREQLEAVRAMVSRNADWMEIATSPAEARRIIGEDNKLAIVLAIEMDMVPIETFLELARPAAEGGLDVALVTPVHVADNALGGTAAYNELFNTHSYFASEVRGAPEFVRVLPDPRLTFRYGPPQGALVEAVLPSFSTVDDATSESYHYAPLGCAESAPGVECVRLFGHRNACGVRPGGDGVLDALARAGVMIDVAHMGEATTSDTLAWAERRRYPVLATHGGVRGDDRVADTERGMLECQARRVAALGGVFGLGTAGHFDAETRLLLRADAERAPAIATVTASTPVCLLASGHTDAGCSTTTPPHLAELPGSSAIAPALFDRIEIAWGGEPATDGAIRIETSDPLLRPWLGAGEGPGTEPPAPTCPTRRVHRAGCIPTDDDACAGLAPVCESVSGRTTCTVSLGSPERLADLAELALVREGGDVIAVEELTVALFSWDGVAPVVRYPVPVRAIAQETVLFARGERHETTRADAGFAMIELHTGCAADGDCGNFTTVAYGRSAYGEGSEVCGRLRFEQAGACVAIDAPPGTTSGRCRPGFFSLNLGGAFREKQQFDRFVRLPDGASSDAICGIELEVRDLDRSQPAAVPISSVHVRALRDPLERWVDDYDALSRIFGARSGGIALGTDYDGSAPRFPFAARAGAAVTAPSEIDGCAVPAPTTALSHAGRVTLRDRGWATYGMLPELVAALRTVEPAPLDPEHPDVDRGGTGEDAVVGLHRSAEAFIRHWELARTCSACIDGACPDACRPGAPESCELQGFPYASGCGPLDAGCFRDPCAADATPPSCGPESGP